MVRCESKERVVRSSLSSSSSSPSSPSLCVAFVSDFCYPGLGGVELHQYQLAQALRQRGHKVIFLTSTYGSTSDARPGARRQGIRYLTGGIKAYYLPMLPIFHQATLPTEYGCFALFRDIALRERITIVHGHQSTSSLAHECLLHAQTMGIATVFTEHSLFPFDPTSSTLLNKVLSFTLVDTTQVVCVSNCARENLVLRAGTVDPHNVSVIPNAIDAARFRPLRREASKPPNGDLDSIETQRRTSSPRVTIVIIGRLVYRKGIDLVADVIPPICARFPHAHFLIGGDGPKRLMLEECIEKHQLQDRVELLGAVPHARVRDVLCRGDIFLNCSLTESFCIAILEAVSCGLLVVSTRVGGVPEILPPSMITFAEPDSADVLSALSDAIPRAHTIDRQALHDAVKAFYSWHDVAERTEIVYRRALHAPVTSIVERLAKYYHVGPFAGPLFCVVALIDYMLLMLLEWWFPADEIELAPDLFDDNDVQDRDGGNACHRPDGECKRDGPNGVKTE